MHSKNGRPQHICITKRFLVAGLTLLFTCIFFSPQASAQQHHQLADGPSILSVQAGFNGTYRIGNWIPIQVKVNNNGNQFDGIISVSLATSSANTIPLTSISVYQTAISLPAISQKQITLYAPTEPPQSGQGAPNSLTIHLQDSNHHEVTKQSVTINNVASNELYIGLISDQSLDIRQLTGALSGHNAHTHVEPLSVSTLPTGTGFTLALNNFDLLVLDNATTSTLNNDQHTALQGWVNQGGTLVEVGGPEWHHTLGSLPTSLLPITVTGTDTIAAGQHLLPQSGNTIGANSADDTLSTSVPVSVATPKPGSLVLLASNNIPLIVQANMGQGLIYYLAYDPFLDPLVKWTNTSTLWTNLLLRTLGDQILTIDNPNSAYTDSSASKYNLYLGINAFLESLIPNALPSIWLILTLLISYVLILGPLRFLLIRWLKKKAWSWRIVVATIVIFSLLSYGLALQVKGTSIVSSHISVLQLSQPNGSGSQAHVTNYVGVYVPSQGDFHVHIPGTRFAEVIDQSSPYGPYAGPSRQSSPQTTAITTQANSTDVDLQGVDTWTLRTLTTKYDTQVQGGITSNLSLSQNTITGTVTNTLPYSLNDTYLLVGTTYIPIGKLESKQTKSVQRSVGVGPAPSLAEQIATSKGININQYGMFNPNLSTDANYRHAAMLEALSRGNCNIGPCPPNYTGPVEQGLAPSPHLLDGPKRDNSQDPLLVSGAAVTIIGWINNSLETTPITINDGTISGTQESLIQAPLNLHFVGTVDVPPSLSTGQIIDVQLGPNSNASPQAVGAGIYSLSAGSITFELQLPVTSNFQYVGAPTLTFNEDPIASKSAYSNGPTNDASTMSISLYNWQANTWDSKTFNPNTFKVDNAQHYIDPNGRILIRFANGQNSQATAMFTTPGVELNATIAG
jgi:hypothetical protein